MTAPMDPAAAAWVLAAVIAPRVHPAYRPRPRCWCHRPAEQCPVCDLDAHDLCWGRLTSHETQVIGIRGEYLCDQLRDAVWLADRVCGRPCTCTVCTPPPPQDALF